MLKSKEETLARPDDASAMELAVATLEHLTVSVRIAVNRDDARILREALMAISAQVDMIQDWMSRTPAGESSLQ